MDEGDARLEWGEGGVKWDDLIRGVEIDWLVTAVFGKKVGENAEKRVVLGLAEGSGILGLEEGDGGEFV